MIGLPPAVVSTYPYMAQLGQVISHVFPENENTREEQKWKVSRGRRLSVFPHGLIYLYLDLKENEITELSLG